MSLLFKISTEVQKWTTRCKTLIPAQKHFISALIREGNKDLYIHSVISSFMYVINIHWLSLKFCAFCQWPEKGRAAVIALHAKVKSCWEVRNSLYLQEGATAALGYFSTHTCRSTRQGLPVYDFPSSGFYTNQDRSKTTLSLNIPPADLEKISPASEVWV